MHVRPAAHSLSLVALALVALLVFPSMAGAQITNPDPVGHGICTQAPGVEPVASPLCFDTFLMDRASRLVLAAMQWRPVAARPVALSPVRPMAHPRAAR